MKVKVVSCKNPILWYVSRVGEEFEVSVDSERSFLVKDNGFVSWVYKDDVVVVKESNEV